jgi:hypothetical protein
VQRDVERLVEAVVLLEIRPVRTPRNEDEMARRRDRKELRQSLDDAEDERLCVRQRLRVVPHSEDREDDGDRERRPRDAEDDGAAHGRMVAPPSVDGPGKKSGANCGNPVNTALDPSGCVP